MSASFFRGAQPPPSGQPAMYDVISVEGGETLDVTILDSAILGVDCHWTPPDATAPRGRSRLCTEFEGDCPYHDYRRVWMGFLAVLNNRARKRDVLRVGPVGAVALARFGGSYVGLRGARVVMRKGTMRKGQSVICEQSPLPAEAPIPQAHDVLATVCNVLGCSRLPEFRYDAQEIAERNGNGQEAPHP